jgi:hypothetical protein
MGRGRANNTDSDVTRLLRCARKARVKIRGRVTKEGIEFETLGPQQQADQPQEEKDEWRDADPL